MVGIHSFDLCPVVEAESPKIRVHDSLRKQFSLTASNILAGHRLTHLLLQSLSVLGGCCHLLIMVSGSLQAMLLNDILGVERDIAEFGLAAGEDFGGLAVDTTELERTLDELVGPAALV